jgi:allophanate hydrolase
VADAVLKVRAAGGLTTLQDKGRFGYQRYGVTEGGAMDRASFAVGQKALRKTPFGTAIEIGLGGLSLDCVSGGITFAVTGGDFSVTLPGRSCHGWMIADLCPGEGISIRPRWWGNWCYLTFAGNIAASTWLGSSAVNPALAFTGRPLVEGDEIVVQGASLRAAAPRQLPVPVFSRPRSEIRVVLGPQERFFEPMAFQRLFGERFAISMQYDRMGVRLEGPELPIATSLDMPSEGILRGSLQVQGSGRAVALMADHQTTGGYPKIATIISTDQDVLGQLRPRHPVVFRSVTVDQAVQGARNRARAFTAYMDSI